MQIQINHTDGRVIDFCFGVFGGAIYGIKDYCNDNSDRKHVFRWEITGDRARDCLRRILPFFRIKKDQAELAIRMQDRIRNSNGRLSSHEIELREQLYQESRTLKQKCIPPARVETKRSNPSRLKECDSPTITE